MQLSSNSTLFKIAFVKYNFPNRGMSNFISQGPLLKKLFCEYLEFDICSSGFQ